MSMDGIAKRRGDAWLKELAEVAVKDDLEEPEDLQDIDVSKCRPCVNHDAPYRGCRAVLFRLLPHFIPPLNLD